MALSQGSLTEDAVSFHIYNPPCLSYLTHPPSALPAVGTWTPYKKVTALNSRVRPKLYPDTISAGPSCWLWVSYWPEVRGCPHRLESDILPQREIPLELLCLPASFHPSGPGSSGPSECFSASPHHALVDVHLSHTSLLSCHVVSTSTFWLLSGKASPPTLLLLPAYSLPPPLMSLLPTPPPDLQEIILRTLGENTNKPSAVMNRGSRKWSRWGKPGVWSSRHLPLFVSVLENRGYIYLHDQRMPSLDRAQSPRQKTEEAEEGGSFPSPPPTPATCPKSCL